MEMDPNPPSFNIPMNVAPMNLGQDFASGMQAGQQAGEALGKGISAAFDVYTRSRTADDVLQALNQNKILSDDAYKSVAGKSLGAKEQLLGMYSGAWMAQQKAQIDAQIAVQKSVAEQAATHPSQRPLVAQQGGPQQPAGGQPAGAPGVPPQPPQAASTLAPLPGAPQVNVPNLTMTSQQPFAPAAPLGSASITNPTYNAPSQYKMGAPIGKGQIPPYSRFVTVKGKPGVLLSDGVTISPLSGE